LELNQNSWNRAFDGEIMLQTFHSFGELLSRREKAFAFHFQRENRVPSQLHLMAHRGGGGGGGGRGGAYYRNKYGGGGRGRGGRGRGRGRGSGGFQDNNGPPPGSNRVRDSSELRGLLSRLDNGPYGAYKDLYGTWSFVTEAGPVQLVIDHVQSDPFAAPSKAHIVVDGNVAGFPEWTRNTKIRRVALADFLSRRFAEVANELGADQKAQSASWGGAKGGDVRIDRPWQHVLERTSVMIDSSTGAVQARFNVGLPARGRSILGEWAYNILTGHLPNIACRSLFARSLNEEEVRKHIDCVEDQEYLRSQLKTAGLAAFVINGAVLPRASGASDKPMNRNEAIPFKSPASLEKSFTLPHTGEVTGMGLPLGICLIVGGGFHGKSTLLQALEKGVYNHIPGDGREFVVCSHAAVKIRAEDGRCVRSVNITPFINNLPYGRDTSAFSTDDASGSTSQAANIVEALEVGSDTLLVDEDTCATNFMIRDEKMMKLVSSDKEPITPFLHKVRALHERKGVSSILVIGGSGDYFKVADCVVMMDSYVPYEVTTKALDIAAEQPDTFSTSIDFGELTPRKPLQQGFPIHDKISTRSLDKVSFGHQDLDLSGVEQLVEVSQVRAIADIIQWCVKNRAFSGSMNLDDILKLVLAEVAEHGLDHISQHNAKGDLVLPRKFEIAAAINRLRSGKYNV